MIDYNKWADEYLSNALETKRLIEEYRTKKKNTKSNQLRVYYDRKILILYEMYSDLIYSSRELRKKADRIRKRG